MNDQLSRVTLAATLFVDEFMTATGQVITQADQARLVVEEAMEMMDAAVRMTYEPTLSHAEEYLKEVADFLYVRAGYVLLGQQGAEVGDFVSAVTIGDIHTMGNAVESLHIALENFVDPEVALAAVILVHTSNMTKLDDEGMPIFNEHGKVMKGPNYQPPVLTELAEEVLENFKEFTAPLSSLQAA